MAHPADAVERLLPSPRVVERRPGILRLDSRARIRRTDESAAGERAAGFLAARLRERAALRIPVVGPGAPPGESPEVRLEIAPERPPPTSPPDGLPPEDLAPEGFELIAAPEGARIRAGDAAGLRYGAEAFAQLTAAGGAVPALLLRDRPALGRRGFLLDISRGRVPTLAWLESLIALLARLRYNELLLYTEHTFAFPSHPEIGAGSGRLTGAEIRRLAAVAAEHSVDLVPCLQTFGHFRRILELDRYRPLAESEQLWSLSPEAPGAYPLLADLLGDYLPCFASPWAHLNCDEPVDLGKGKSAARAEAEGLGALFADHVNRVAGMARALGKRPMIWADVLADHPEALDRLAPDLVLADWWYEADHDFDRVARFRAAGREFLTVAGTSSWSSLFPRLDTAAANIRGHAAAARRHGASGFILTDWGDGGHFNLFAGSLYPLALGAEAAWGDETRPEAETAAAFSEHFAGDPGGFAGRFASRLGRLHDAGFRHFNHSPLKTVFFETRPLRTRRVPAEPALRETLEALRALAAEAESAGLPAGAIGEDWRYVLDASLLAAERGRALLRYRAHREGDGAGAEDLASDLRSLADRQTALGRRFRASWRRDNRPEGIETASNLHRRAAAALRRAANRVDRAEAPARRAPRAG